MKKLAFGYKCEQCGRGLVQERVLHEYPTKLKGLPLIVDEAHIGVCEECGARYFDPNETDRWRTLLTAKYAENYLQPADIRELQQVLGLSRAQFAILLGCTRQSLYNWERPNRTVPQSRMADLLMRLVRESYSSREVDVLSFLATEARKIGVDLRISRGSNTAAAKIIAFPNKRPVTSMIDESLAADSNPSEDVLFLITEAKETIGRLYYHFRDASLRLQFVNEVPFCEFDADVYFKDGKVAQESDLRISDREAILVSGTERSEDSVDHIVIIPKVQALNK